jgi:hypothetical protein
MNGVSFDYSKAQQVEAFAQFLELLSDPAALAKLFADIKEARKSAEEAIAAKTKVVDVDAYVARAEADIDRKYSEMEAQEAALKEQAEELIKRQAEFQARVEAKDREQKVASDAVALALTDAKKEAEAVKVLKVQVEAEKVAFESARKEAEVRAADLAEKQEALKKVLGG